MQRKLLLKLIYGIPIVCIGGFLLGDKCNAASSATLTLGNGSNSTQSLSTTVTQGDIAYLSSTIKVDATDIESYTLSISGPVGLSSNGGSTITGANNKTPANMTNNSWGYAYNDSNANNTKTYKSFTGSAQTLETGTPNGNLTGTAKNITFAAKFASNATSTHYTASVTVLLVATPKSITLTGISTMQAMTSAICAASAENETTQLTDARDSKSYWVAKLKDGNCWMVQNLDYDGGGEKHTTSGTWIDNSSTAQYWDPGEKIGNGTGSSATGSTDKHTLVGNYYSFVAAQTVCPDDWRLPTSNSTTENGSFGKLLSGISTGDILIASPYYFQYGGRIGGKFSGPTFMNGGTTGDYWSSTPNPDADYRAYTLTFSATSVEPSNPQSSYGQGKGNGLSVRCLYLVS